MTENLNSLANASSAYLRSAMNQPIRWHQWGEEAFARAREENKPILLDIGAVWCHWCHVMDRESYENPEIALIVNERFVAIKVDRDERPDVDSRHQVAIQAISGQGGWPLTAFLTPEGKPFYGGTYFPPTDQYGRPSFRRVLLAISDAFREKQADVADQAKLVEGAVASAETFQGKRETISARLVAEIRGSALKQFDEQHGGFGSAPKFPHPAMLDLVIDEYLRSGDERLRRIFTLTLETMARGGIYDQLGGGFHRYSVDDRWVVPHFEKMSYDNSELLKNYVHAYQATGERFFSEVARDVIRWIDEWLSDQEHGGFYASQDADYSMDDDGDYFTWTTDEAKSVLTEEEARIVGLHYDLNEIGEMHHNPAKNVLYQRASVEEIVARLGLSEEAVRERIALAKQKMYAARLERPTPFVDKTIYVSWNALLVSAYLEVGSLLGLESARRFALRSLDRVLGQAWSPEAGLAHVAAYSDRTHSGSSAGFLDDYAFTATACLDAYQATADLSYFHMAQQIADQMVERFYDPKQGGFFDSDRNGAKLGVLGAPRKPFQDSPTPAGNPMAAIALLRLHGFTDEESYREKALRTLELLSGVAGQYGLFAATYGIALLYALQPTTQIVVVGEDERASELYRQALNSQLYGRSVVKLNFSQAVAPNLPPALAHTIPELPAVKAGATTAVVCSGLSCKPPVHTGEELNELLRAVRSAA